MFDLDELEDLDPSKSVEDLQKEEEATNAAAAAEAAAKLDDERFNVRRDACKALAALGPAAAPFAAQLGQRAEQDEDWDVCKAAISALVALREQGVVWLQALDEHEEPEVRKAARKGLKELEKDGINVKVKEAAVKKPVQDTKHLQREEENPLENFQPPPPPATLGPPKVDPDDEARFQRYREQKANRGTEVTDEPARQPRVAKQEYEEPKPMRVVRHRWKDEGIEEPEVLREAHQAIPVLNEGRGPSGPPLVIPSAPSAGRKPHPGQNKPEELQVWDSSGASGPTVLCKIFDETLAMRLEHDGMTPSDLVEIWEKEWGITGASRVKFGAPPEYEKRYLNAKEDLLPGPPSVVKLEAKLGSVLQTLALKIKRYGALSVEETQQKKSAEQQKFAAAAQRRQMDDARQLDHWAQLEQDRIIRLQSEGEEERRRRREDEKRRPWRYANPNQGPVHLRDEDLGYRPGYIRPELRAAMNEA
mmetsp:Transcript_49359/g.86944  ORF Transcript_49359/g.86944 Transcript_49359/m.86944 type:complete len:476 (-) Transcript_49359:36-1463(-)